MTYHFTLAELTRTSTGLPNVAPPDAERRLLALRDILLEPLRAVTGPLIVTSGYRSPAVNERVGGAKLSSHRFGCAADLVPVDCSVEHAFLTAQRLRLPYDQLIHEKRGAVEWLHIALPRPGETARKQSFHIWR